jgi:hypothetical protein
MKHDTDFFVKLAGAMIDFVLEPAAQDRVYEKLSRLNPELGKLGRTRFLEEYVPSKLALGCGFWEQCCEAHAIGDKETRNLCFRQIMKRFESPKSLAMATRFSECLYAANAHPDGSPLIEITTHLFEKLGLKRIAGESATSGISASFLFAVEVGEALKNAFENEFDDRIYRDTDLRNGEIAGKEVHEKQDPSK